MSTDQALPTETSTFKQPEYVEVPVQPGIKETELFSWTAPARPFRRRDKEFYVTLIAIASVVGLILFIAEGLMPVVMIASLIFLYYVLNTVEPGNIQYRITTRGINIANSKTGWDALSRFWFAKRLDSNLLIFETNILPGRLEMVIKEEDKGKIQENLLNYLIEEEAPPSNLEKWASWFSKKLPNN